MKLTLVLLLLCASVALLKAEEIEQDEELSDETSVDFLHDGSLEDEVLGDEEDPKRHKKRHALKHLGGRRVCARVFVGCLIKTKARCKLVPVCKVKYFACRCIVKGVRKCRRFLRFVARLRRRHQCRHHHRHRHDEVEEDEDEDARKGGKKKRKALKKIVRKCKRGYRRCSRGKKFCGKCLRGFGACMRKHSIKKQKGQKGDESEDEDTIMADAAENHEDEEEINEEESEDPRGHRKPNAAMRRCGKRGLKCMLRARLNCGKQGRCFHRLLKCVRRARRRRGGKKQ